MCHALLWYAACMGLTRLLMVIHAQSYEHRPAPKGHTLSVAAESAMVYRGGGEAREWGDSAVGKMRRERASMLLARLFLMGCGRVWGPCGPSGRSLAEEVWDCRLEGASKGSC